MKSKTVTQEIDQLTDKLAGMVDEFGRTFNMGLGIKITETRKLLRQKKEQLAQVETVGPFN